MVSKFDIEECREHVISSLWQVLRALAESEAMLGAAGGLEGRILKVSRSIEALARIPGAALDKLRFLVEFTEFAQTRLSEGDFDVIRPLVKAYADKLKEQTKGSACRA